MKKKSASAMGYLVLSRLGHARTNLMHPRSDQKGHVAQLKGYRMTGGNV
jgi:hypothetical protein